MFCWGLIPRLVLVKRGTSPSTRLASCVSLNCTLTSYFFFLIKIIIAFLVVTIVSRKIGDRCELVRH